MNIFEHFQKIVQFIYTRTYFWVGWGRKIALLGCKRKKEIVLKSTNNIIKNKEIETSVLAWKPLEACLETMKTSLESG